MKFKFLLSFVCITGLFFVFSYVVAGANWQKIDFQATVFLQNYIPRTFDRFFSFFSLLGSFEVTGGFCLLMAARSFFQKKWQVILGWLMIIPASVGELFGKLVLFHPAPPHIFHRTVLPSGLPQLYIYTNFSYPSGHMTRTIFIATVLISAIIFAKIEHRRKLALTSLILVFCFMMGLTRVYLGEHWLSDVVGGSMWGIAMGLIAVVLILLNKRVIKGGVV